MKILNEKPPVWDSVCRAFQINPMSAVFTYGDIIYNPSGVELPEHIIIHEGVHQDQQAGCGGPALWWGKYLREPEFRVNQEAEAYGVQYAFICRKTQNRSERFNFLKMLSHTLSGPLYQNAISFQEAMKKIQEYSGVPV